MHFLVPLQPHTLGQCINGDEGAALGATFVAANASSAFRIENSKFLDPSGFGYTVRLKGASEKGTEHDCKDILDFFEFLEQLFLETVNLTDASMFIS